MATSAEIRNKAAKKLGVLGTGQTLESSISADIDDAYTEVYARLKAKSLVTWVTSGSVPDEVVEPVVALVARARVTEYGVTQKRYAEILADALDAEGRIREVIAQTKTGQTKIESF